MDDVPGIQTPIGNQYISPVFGKPPNPAGNLQPSGILQKWPGQAARGLRGQRHRWGGEFGTFYA